MYKALLEDNDCEKKFARFGVKNGDEVFFVNTREILFLERIGKKVMIHSNNCEYETSVSLCYFEKKLQGSFFRAHKSYLVNLDLIEKVVSWNENTYQIRFKNSKKEACLSRRQFFAMAKLLPVLS